MKLQVHVLIRYVLCHTDYLLMKSLIITCYFMHFVFFYSEVFEFVPLIIKLLFQCLGILHLLVQISQKFVGLVLLLV